MKAIRLKNRPGFDTFGMRIIYRVLFLFFNCRLVSPENLPEDGEPVVFVANHYSVFGPVSFILSVPLISSVWVNEDIITPETAAETIYSGIRDTVPFLGEKAFRWICGLLGRLTCKILVRFNAIPVNRNNPGRLISTMRRSVSALAEGQNLIVFPETGVPEYSLTSVTPFYSGFATVGSLYYRKTGKPLRFCPCYIDEQHHTIRFGELITYQAEDTSVSEESRRVSDELNLSIQKMAAASRHFPCEKNTPIGGMIIFFCNLLRLLILIPLIVTLSISNPHISTILYAVSQGLRILFNAAVSRSYAASNHFSFLVSHVLGLITDICMLFYLYSFRPFLRWLLLVLIFNCIITIGSNFVSLVRIRWFAGTNYFDTLSANLICFICFQQILDITLPRFFLGYLLILTYVFLVLSAGYTVIFNLRFREETDNA